MLMASPRQRLEEYSLAITLVQASMPPIPRPVTTRQIPSSTAECAREASSMPAVARPTEIRTMGRRPMTSAKGARPSEPMAMPTSPALKQDTQLRPAEAETRG